MAVGSGGRGAGAKGTPGKQKPQAPEEGPRGRGAVTRAGRSLPRGSPGGFRPRPSHCLGDAPLHRQTAPCRHLPALVPARDSGFHGEAKARVGRRGHATGGRLGAHTAVQGACCHGVAGLCAQGRGGVLRGAGQPPPSFPFPPCPFLPSFLPPSVPSFLPTDRVPFLLQTTVGL